MTPDMSGRFREVTEALMTQLREPAAKAQLAVAQADSVNELLGQLSMAQQAMTATAGTLAEATAAMQGMTEATMRGAEAPKRIELIRDEQGRAAGAVVHQDGVPARQIELVRDRSGALAGAR